MSLDEMLFSVLEENYIYLQKHGINILPETKAMIDYYGDLLKCGK